MCHVKCTRARDGSSLALLLLLPRLGQLQRIDTLLWSILPDKSLLLSLTMTMNFSYRNATAITYYSYIIFTFFLSLITGVLFRRKRLLNWQECIA